MSAAFEHALRVETETRAADLEAEVVILRAEVEELRRTLDGYGTTGAILWEREERRRVVEREITRHRAIIRARRVLTAHAAQARTSGEGRYADGVDYALHLLGEAWR